MRPMVKPDPAGTPRRGGGAVIVGLSGGVDSAVAAALLQRQGYDVIGVTLETWHAQSTAPVPSATDRAQAVADHLGIPLVRRDVRQAFYDRVIRPFADTYAAGRTPNPCVLCNPTLKFATLVEEADDQGATWIATGHYARVDHDRGTSRLRIARAAQKDQSYALYRLTQPQLRRLLLPLGNVETKDEVRAIANHLQLPVSDAAESQDLCFVAEGGYADLLASLRPEALEPGPILDLSGQRLGEHTGLAQYTVGQRIGGLTHRPGAPPAERRYVLALDSERNALIAGPRTDLARTSCTLAEITFTLGEPPAPVFTARGRIRYRAPLVPVTVTLREGATAHITFATPQTGVAPGQSLVLYGPCDTSDEVCLGGGSYDEVCLGGGMIQTAEHHPT